MKPRASALVLVAAGLVALGPACSGRSIVIGGDPLGEADTAIGGTLSSGGVGVGGAFPTGGTSLTGGAFPTGGTPATGGTSPATGGSGGADVAEGGADGVVDPYPRVAYEDGQGYRRSCPSYENGWGFTCWNFDVDTHSCSPNGDPYCNACSCAVPCESGAECPRGITGHPADCIASATTAKSCFLVCSDGGCPTGMTCTPYPGVNRNVCVWVSESPFGQPPI